MAEVKSFLAAFYTSEASYFAENSSYTTHLDALYIALPSYLARFGRVEVVATGTTFKATFVGTAYPVLGQSLSIDHTKAIEGSML